jgi:hypothetical protein
MNLSLAISITARLLAFTMFLQGLELFFLTRKKDFFEIWSFNNLKGELENGLPLPNSLIAFLFSEVMFKSLIVLQIIAAVVGLIYLDAFSFGILFLTHLLICIRFRGTFNGGSDMMTFVVLTGVLITLNSSHTATQKLGLIYITIHTIYSYFKAGIAKIVHADWRRGQALGPLLERSLFVEIRLISKRLSAKAHLYFILCWCVLIFELMALGLPFFSQFTLYYFLSAALFHFVIYYSLGLNRFFWIWMSAWPAVFYSISLLHSK